MIFRRATAGLFAAIIAGSSFFFGFNSAIGAPVVIEDLIFSEEEDHSDLTISADGSPDIRFSYGKSAKTLTIRFLKTPLSDIFDGIEYEDEIIESVKIVREKDSGDTLLKVVFKNQNISFFTVPAPYQGGVSVKFRAKEAPIRITGVTPEQLMAQKTKPPEPEAEQPAQEEAPVEEQAPAEEETAAEESEEEDDALVAEEPEDEKDGEPEQAQPEKVIVVKKFPQIDKKSKKLGEEAGREKFLEFMSLLQQNKFEEAAKSANQFLKAYPTSIYRERVVFSRGEALYLWAKRDGARISDAITAYNEAVAMFPESKYVPQALMHKGNLYVEQQFLIEGLTEYGGLLQVSPTGKYNVAAMMARAEIYMKQKKHKKAYNELEKILILFPNRREVRNIKYLVAESYFDRGKYDIADKVFGEALKQWPTFPKTHPMTYFKIAENNYQVKKYGQAMEDWLTIINLFPVSREARRSMLRLGDTYVERDRKHDAAELFEKLVRRYPKNDEAVLGRMRLASLGAEDPELVKHSQVFDYSAFLNPYVTFNQIINKENKKFGEEALLRKGKAFAAQKRYFSSILAFKELLKGFPSAKMSDEVFGLVRSNFLEMINTYYKQEGFFIVLMTYYDNFDPFLRGIEDPGILMKIADSYSHMTLFDRAIEYYRLANSFDPKGENLRETAFQIARNYKEKKDYDEAERLLKQYLREFPSGKNALTTRHLLGDIMAATGRPAQAATEWRLAIERDFTSPRVSFTAYELAQSYKDERQYSMAVDAYNRSIDSYRPSLDTGKEERHIQDSYYQLAELRYLDGDYPNAIKDAKLARERYPESERNLWMEYIISSSYERINRDDLAAAQLKAISEKDKQSVIGRVSTAKLQNYEWKKKNHSLFMD